MFQSIGAPELLIVLGIIVVVFGAGKLSGLGAALGKSIREFHEERDGIEGKPDIKEVHKSESEGKTNLLKSEESGLNEKARS